MDEKEVLFVTIPVKEYKKLIKKVEKQKYQLAIAGQTIAKVTTEKYEFAKKYEDAIAMIEDLQGENNVESE